MKRNFRDGKTFVIAEIGGNHEGDFEYAKRLLLDVADSGADAVKFQSYKPDLIVSRVENEVRNKHFGKFALSDEQFMELAKLAKDKGIMFMASFWDEKALDLFDPLVEVHKVGSGDLTNYPLLEKIALKNKPMIIATAMSTLQEVKNVINFIRKVNPSLVEEGNLAILQCVAMYGEPLDKYANLNVIETYKKELPSDVVIGYSDHTTGIHAANIAVGMGAKVLEIHYTDDKNREFRDHHLSIIKEEMKQLISDIRRTEVMLGSFEKKPVAEIENEQRIWEFRRAVYFKGDVKAGTVASEENLITLRPNEGIDARRYYDVLGKTLKVDKKAHEKLSWEDFD
ncbi:MAG: N-acetylneuraminate synthase family protein [Nanoarchaeota archaeon]|nr:N-acetylneuraminate synthase family protein [Nanoarchaeota archaeon]